MKFIKTKLKDLLVVKQKNYTDKRGSLREIFEGSNFNKNYFIMCILFLVSNLKRLFCANFVFF